MIQSFLLYRKSWIQWSEGRKRRFTCYVPWCQRRSRRSWLRWSTRRTRTGWKRWFPRKSRCVVGFCLFIKGALYNHHIWHKWKFFVLVNSDPNFNYLFCIISNILEEFNHVKIKYFQNCYLRSWRSLVPPTDLVILGEEGAQTQHQSQREKGCPTHQKHLSIHVLIFQSFGCHGICVIGHLRPFSWFE